MFRFTAPKSALVAAALCTAAVFAAPAAFAKSIEVRYDDLDLTTTKGQDALNARIVRAARNVCRMDLLPGSHINPIDRTCYKQALFEVGNRVASAVEKAGATQLGG